MSVTGRITWVCIDCGMGMSIADNEDGIRCYNCGGCIVPKGNRLIAKVETKGLEPFKRLATVLGELALDERIHKAIRMEYMSKIIMDK